MDLKNKRVTVIGLGNSGVNASLLLKNAGAIVWATDSQDTPSVRKSCAALEKNGIQYEIGKHTEGFIKGSDLVVVSPGVDDFSPAVKWAMKYDIPVIGEMELGYRFCKGRIIAVTGTNGKSTVTTLIGEILKQGGEDAVVCGNIGNSLCGEIDKIKEDTWVALEVSSFQLEKIKDFKPHIALILNITDDHMDRYTKSSDYYNEKLKIFSNQDENDILILNYDAENLREIKNIAGSKVLFYSRMWKTNGSYVKGGDVWCIGPSGKEENICPVGEVKLRGLYNIENILASVLAGSICGIAPSSIKNTITTFSGLSHRFETVAMIDGVEYIDDSKGTTVDSTIRALESCAKPVVLIAGGKDKNSDYAAARSMVENKVKDLILIGEAACAIKKALGQNVNTHDAKDMLDAVRIAAGLAKKNYAVLLSPMCSSFDMFSSYKERGEVFKKCVFGLKDKYPEGIKK